MIHYKGSLRDLKCSGAVLATMYCFAVPLNGQYMQDTSSTYQDMWFGDTTVYITGSTSGSMSIHRYRVALTLRLPSGGVFTSTPVSALRRAM